MKKYLFILISAFTATMIGGRPAHALKVTDILTKVQDVLEQITETLKTAEERISDAESKMRNSKMGEYGKSALKGYNEVSDVLMLHRKLLPDDVKLSPLDVPEYLQGTLKNVDKAEEAIKVKYIAKYGGDNATTKSKHQKRQDMEVQHNNVATLYAKAYAIRFHLKKVRLEQIDPQVDLKESRSLIQAGRAYAENTNRRILDMIAMEMALLEFNSTEVIFASKSQRKDMANVIDEEAID